MFRQWLIAAVGLVLAACSAGGMGDLSGIISMPGPGSASSGPLNARPVQIYARVARGLMRCWLGRDGELHGGYIFAGRAEPEAEGGNAEIVLHEKTDQGERGLAAITISMRKQLDATRLAVDNKRLKPGVARRMTRDARRWGEGETGCQSEEVIWAQQTEAHPPAEEAEQ